jgi:hypothetical protein
LVRAPHGSDSPARSRPAADEFIGLRVRGGSVRMTGATHPDPTRIVLQGAWSIDFELALDLPAGPVAPTQTGQDAAQVRMTDPRTVRLTFSGRPPRRGRFRPVRGACVRDDDRLRAERAAPFVDALSRARRHSV